MKYTVRPVFLAHKTNEDGLGTIRIALTIDRVITYQVTTYRIHKTQWDPKKRTVINHPNAGLINIDLKREVAKVEDRVLNNKLQSIPVTHKLIKEESIKPRSFATYAAEVRNVQKEINRITTFHGNGLMLSEIDTAFLRKYEKHERERGMSQNTINQTFKYLRRIINQALAEGLIKDNPYKGFLMPKYVQTDRIYLIESEIKKMYALLKKDLPEDLYKTLCYFLLGCYSGLRHSDWCKFEADTMVEDGYLKLRAKKNKTFVVLPIGPTLKGIINRVRDLPPPYTNQKCNEKLKSLSFLAKVKKKISTHTGRHSFGYLCASNGLPKSVTAELLGVNFKTVEVYYHLSGENIIQQAAVLKSL